MTNDATITVTMTETTHYDYTYPVQQLIDWLGLPEGTSAEAVAAVINGKPDAAEAAGLDAEAFDAACDFLDSELLDSILNHYEGTEDREWGTR